MRILFTGGGTGGHIIPIIAIAREIKDFFSKHKKLELYYMGPKDEISQELCFTEGIKYKRIVSGKIRRYSGIAARVQNLIDIAIRIPIGIVQSFFYIFFVSPDLIVSKGGYGSIPPAIAGRILQVPIFLHESDIAPGLANKTVGKFAIEIFSSFPKTENFSPEKIILVGNPTRRDILDIPNEKEMEESLGFKKTKPVILIIGGSQGSERINELILATAPKLLSEYEIIHQCGIKNYQSIKNDIKFLIPEDLIPYYHLYSFISEKELKSAYHRADLIVSRSGSATIFEVAALGKPSMLIPLPESAQNHQMKNAYAYSEGGAAIVIEEENLTPNFFLKKVQLMLSDEKRMKVMSLKAKSFSRPKSARIIAEYIVEYLGE